MKGLEEEDRASLRATEEEASCSEESFLSAVRESCRDLLKAESSSVLHSIVEYHFKDFGKMFRSRMLYRLAKCFGIPSDQVLCWAVSCEVLHNACLIHDDIQDGDDFRRGRNSVWKEFGVEHAINAGDYFLTKAPASVLSSSLRPELKCVLLRVFSHMSAEIVRGQMEELSLNQLVQLDKLESDYIQQVSLKTSALFSGLAVGAALVAGLSKKDIEKVSELFLAIGVLFQVQDDLLDYYGDKQRGCRGNDLKEGKVSFVVLTHLEKYPEDLSYVKTLLQKSRESCPQEEIDRYFQRFDSLGGLPLLELKIQKMLRQIQLLSQKCFDPSLEKFVSQLCSEIFLPVQSKFELKDFLFRVRSSGE